MMEFQGHVMCMGRKVEESKEIHTLLLLTFLAFLIKRQDVVFD